MADLGREETTAVQHVDVRYLGNDSHYADSGHLIWGAEWQDPARADLEIFQVEISQVAILQ